MRSLRKSSKTEIQIYDSNCGSKSSVNGLIRIFVYPLTL